MLSINNIHVKNIQKLMNEFYKYPHHKQIYAKKILNYNLLKSRVILLQNLKTEKNGAYMVAYKAAQLRSTLPARYKNLSTLVLFKSQIKTWHS